MLLLLHFCLLLLHLLLHLGHFGRHFLNHLAHVRKRDHRIALLVVVDTDDHLLVQIGNLRVVLAHHRFLVAVNHGNFAGGVGYRLHLLGDERNALERVDELSAGDLRGVLVARISKADERAGEQGECEKPCDDRFHFISPLVAEFVRGG